MNAYYEKGATHNDHHKEMNIQLSGNLSPDIIDRLMAGFMQEDAVSQDLMPDEDEEGEDCSLPPELATEKARAVLQGLQRIGVLGDGFQPQGLSWSECGYLAQQLAYKLGIDHQWVVFGKLWHLDGGSLRSGYNRSKDQRKMSAFDEKIKEIIR